MDHSAPLRWPARPATAAEPEDSRWRRQPLLNGGTGKHCAGSIGTAPPSTCPHLFSGEIHNRHTLLHASAPLSLLSHPPRFPLTICSNATTVCALVVVSPDYPQGQVEGRQLDASDCDTHTQISEEFNASTRPLRSHIVTRCAHPFPFSVVWLLLLLVIRQLQRTKRRDWRSPNDVAGTISAFLLPHSQRAQRLGPSESAFQADERDGLPPSDPPPGHSPLQPAMIASGAVCQCSEVE